MTDLTIVHHGEAAAVVLPASVLESIGLRVGDVLEATLDERRLILCPVEGVLRREAFEQIVKDIF